MAVEKIANGVVVSMSYVLTVDGEEVDRAGSDDPLEYLHGADNIVPGLEEALEGKKVGDKVSAVVPPEQGYGEYDEDEVDEFDFDEIDDAEELEVGMPLEFEEEDEEGNVYIYEGTVMEITEDTVVVDFNAPLAGKTLNFEVEILGLREATAEELDHGHPHSMDGFFEDEE